MEQTRSFEESNPQEAQRSQRAEPSAPTATLPRASALLVLTVLIGVAIRSVIAARGWFYWDDFILRSKASTPLLELLLQDHDGHLMPAAWVLEWVLAHTAPLNWPVAVLTLALLNLAAVGAVAYACWVLARDKAIIPTAVYAVSPLTLPSTTWLAAAVNALPMHAAIAMTMAAAWRGRAWQAMGWFVVGLAFNERMLFAFPLVVGLLAAFAAVSKLEWVEVARQTIFLAVPTVVWSALYLSIVEHESAESSVSFSGLLIHAVRDSLVPVAAGGPWEWERWHPSPPWANPSWFAIAAGVVVIAAGAWWSRAYLVVWLPTILYPLIPVFALWYGRGSGDTALEITQTLRHFSELAVVVALTLAFLARRLPLPRLPLVIIMVSALVSNITFSQIWSDQPARIYFQNLRALDHTVLDQEMPLEMLLPVAHPHNLLSRQLPEKVGPQTTSPALIDAEGKLHPASLMTQRSTLLGRFPGCFSGYAEIPLDGPLYDLPWVLRLNYAAEAPTEATVALSGKPVDVHLDQGLHQLYIQLTGGGTILHFSAQDEVCLGVSDIGVLLLDEAASAIP